MPIKSSEYYRLEKVIDIVGKTVVLGVYEFHAVTGGRFYYVSRHEEYGGREHFHYPSRDCSKDSGNRLYKVLKEKEGYKFAGKYDMDITGKSYPHGTLK